MAFAFPRRSACRSASSTFAVPRRPCRSPTRRPTPDRRPTALSSGSGRVPVIREQNDRGRAIRARRHRLELLGLGPVDRLRARRLTRRRNVEVRTLQVETLVRKQRRQRYDDPAADGRVELQLQPVDRRDEIVAIPGWSLHQLRRSGEGHDPDAHVRRLLLDERLRCFARGLDAAGLDIVRRMLSGHRSPARSFAARKAARPSPAAARRDHEHDQARAGRATAGRAAGGAGRCQGPREPGRGSRNAPQPSSCGAGAGNRRRRAPVRRAAARAPEARGTTCALPLRGRPTRTIDRARSANRRPVRAWVAPAAQPHRAASRRR